MLAPLLLAAALSGLSADAHSADSCSHPSFPSQQQPDSSLRYVYAFFRHGIRSPLYKPYPTDPNKSKYQHYFPGSPGHLTRIGKEMMYNVGKRLKARYGKFVGEYSEEKVFVSSTNMSRTMMSALSVAAGLFPPSRLIFRDLHWQPIPVWQNTTEFDKAYIYNDNDFPKLGVEVCPRYGRFIKKGYDLVVDPDKRHHVLYELLQKYTGKSDVNSVNTHYQIWDTLQFESLNGLPLPAWATKRRPQFQHRPLYPDVMAPVMVDWFLDTEYLHNNEQMLLFYSGPLFNSVHDYLTEKAANPKSPGRLRLHATHDTTLFVILWALKLKKPFTVGPGDGILFELHQANNSTTVKILYYDANHGHTITELRSPVCPPPCSLDHFLNSTRGLTPRQWQADCNASQHTQQTLM